MTRLVAVPLGYLINGIYNLVDNYGISIILMTILIRIIILPLYSMQIKSSEQMMLVQPKVKEIQTKYKDTPEKMQEKLQELYQEHNIKPAMGCLPLLIQLPIIWGLFGLLRLSLIHISEPTRPY